MSHLQRVQELLASLPAEDAAVLRLSSDGQQCHSLALNLVEQHAAHIRTLKALCILNAPIHRLPAEILMTIFYQCRRSIADLRLTHVCRLWRTLISSMPEFWASMLKNRQFGFNIRSELPPGSWEEFLQQCLERSAPRMVHCRLTFRSPLELRTLAPHLLRLTELSLKVWEERSAFDLTTLLEWGMPHLITLRVSLLRFRDDFNSPAYWYSIPPLATCSLPRLRRLQIPAECLPKFMVGSIEHLTIEGIVLTEDIDAVLDTVNHQPLASLTFDRAGVDVWSTELTAKQVAPLARSISVRDSMDAIVQCLQHLFPLPTIRLQLSFCDSSDGEDRVDLDIRFVELLSAYMNRLTAVKRFYLGNTRARGRVRLRGYADLEDGADLAQLDIGKWFEDKCATIELLHLLSTSSAATALTVSLPGVPETKIGCQLAHHLHPLPLELPRQLWRLELLVRTPLQTRLWFAKRFLERGGTEGRPPPGELTLCWNVHVERGYEVSVRDELEALENLLADTPTQKLGRLELYGSMVLSGQVYTKVADVPTNPVRCAEVAQPYLARLGALVGNLVFM